MWMLIFMGLPLLTLAYIGWHSPVGIVASTDYLCDGGVFPTDLCQFLTFHRRNANAFGGHMLRGG